MVILTILSHPIQEYLSISSYALRRVSFTNILQFLVYRSFASVGRFIPRQFFLLDVMVNWIVSLISVSDRLLLVYRNGNKFMCINFVPCINLY